MALHRHGSATVDGTATAGLAVDGLIKRYPRARSLRALLRRRDREDQVEALRGASVSFARGRIHGLIGPNGAGKTTLLKILAGLVLRDEGSVQVDGRELADEPLELRRRVGIVVADERSFFWRLTVAENLRFFASLQGLAGKARAERIDEVLALVDLEPQVGRVFGELSAGMRQRVALARGLLAAPPALLLDEATRSLDPDAAAEIRQLVVRLVAADPARLVVWSSHQLSEVADICDRVVVLRGGRVVATRDLDPTAAGRPAKYRLRLRSPLAHGALDGLAQVVLHRAGELELEVAATDPTALDAVVDRIRAAGVGIAQLEPVVPSIEDLFHTPEEPSA